MTLKYDYKYRPEDEESYRALMDSIEPTGYTSPIKSEENMTKEEDDNMGQKQGIVKFFNNARGFGFINGSDGESYFVHHSGIKPVNDEFRTLDDGQSVIFDVEQDEKGLRAVNVR